MRKGRIIVNRDKKYNEGDAKLKMTSGKPKLKKLESNLEKEAGKSIKKITPRQKAEAKTDELGKDIVEKEMLKYEKSLKEMIKGMK